MDYQRSQKEKRRQEELDKENQFAAQMKSNTLKRGLLENRFLSGKQGRVNEVMEFNQKMALERKVKEENEKRERYLSEVKELELLRRMQEDRDYEGGCTGEEVV